MKVQTLFPVLLALAASPAFAGGASARTIALSVTKKGFEPYSVKVKKGEPLKLVITRKTTQTCATSIILEEYNIERELPLNKPVEIEFTPTKEGKLTYGCSMGMMISGVLLVE